jgi:hypothetical protein
VAWHSAGPSRWLLPLFATYVPPCPNHIHFALLCRGSDVSSLPTRFAWLVGSILCHGHLLLPTQAPAAPAAAASSKPAPESPRSHVNRSPGLGRSSWLGWGWGSQQQQGDQAGVGAGEAVGVLQEVEEASGFVRDMRQLRLGEEGTPSLPEDEPTSMVGRQQRGGEPWHSCRQQQHTSQQLPGGLGALCVCLSAPAHVHITIRAYRLPLPALTQPPAKL